MTVLSAKSLAQIQYTISDSSTSQASTKTDNSQNACDFTYGTGNFQVNSVVKTTGVIPSGSNLSINFGSYNSVDFGVTGVASFKTIKSIVISNTSTSSGVDLNIRATGVNAATSFFNGGSGNLLIKPYSSFIYNDPHGGINTSTANRLQLHNVASTSGTSSGVASYSITVMGII
jgi:hypothetical protein